MANIWTLVGVGVGGAVAGTLATLAVEAASVRKPEKKIERAEELTAAANRQLAIAGKAGDFKVLRTSEIESIAAAAAARAAETAIDRLTKPSAPPATIVKP